MFSHQKKQLCEVMDVLVNLTVGIISQCIRMSNIHTVHFRYITVLSVSYTLIKQEKVLGFVLKEPQKLGFWRSSKETITCG